MRDRLEALLAVAGDRLPDDVPAIGPGRVTARARSLVPTFVRRRYAVKFGIALFVLGTMLALVGVGATAQFSGEVRENVDGEYAATAAADAEKLDDWNERNREFTRMITRSDVIQDGEGELGRQDLFQLQSELPSGAASIHYVDTEAGTVLVSTARATQSTSVSAIDAPWTESLRPGSSTIAVTDGYRSESAGGAPVLAYVAEVPGRTDRSVVYEVKLNAYARFLQEPESNGRTLVVDGEGQILFGDANDQLLAPYADGSSPVLEAAADQPVGTGGAMVLDRPTGALAAEESPLPDASLLVGYARVGGTDWVVLVHGPTEEAYAFANAIMLWGTVATFVGVVLVTLVGAVLGRNTAVAIDRLTAKTERMEAGDLNVSFETDRIDNLGRLYEGFAAMRDALREQIGEAQQARREADAARQEAEATARQLEATADEYGTVMEAVAEGDLGRRMEPAGRNEAMDSIAREFNEMADALAATVADVKSFATEVAASSEEVTAASEEVQGASEQVTESVQEIVDGADRQDEQLRAISEELNGLSTTIEEIASSADQVAGVAERTATTGERGREAAEAAIDEMERVEREAESTVDAMGQLQDRIEHIEEVTEFIQDVAEQTNILALNANIEAARAGEAGEGFAVVADEVKSLAEDTREATERIEGLVAEVREQSETTAAEVRGTSETVARSTETVAEAVDALEEIAEYAEETNVGVQEISEATTEQASSTNEVVGMVEAVADIAEETSEEATTVAGAAEEQTSALTQMTANAQDLSGRAARLSETLDRFRTAEDGAAEPREANAAGTPTEGAGETSGDGTDEPPANRPTEDD